MADAFVEALQRAFEGEVTPDADLSGYTTLKVGGRARVLVEPAHDADLRVVGELCGEYDAPWTVIGRGSNLLVSDTGWHGVAIVLGRGHRGLEIDGTTVVAGAAEPMPVVATKVAAAGLGGFAWGAGVPGSVGGGVRMNAGAHGGEMRDVLVSADLFRLGIGTRETWPNATLGFSYRHSELPEDAVVVQATLELTPVDADEERERVREVRDWRREHQPINEPNCGSVFTNPPDDSAGRLVDDVGGKDVAVGGAHVSATHANFVVTEPGATAADVREVIRRLRQRVHDVHGVMLHPEVRMLGTFDDDGIEVST